MHLTITSNNPKKIDLNSIINTLNKYCSRVDIKRIDESNEIFEVSFLVAYDSYKKLINISFFSIL